MAREFAFVETTTTDEWEQWKRSNVEVSDGTVHLEKESTPVFVSPELVVERLRTGTGVIDIDIDSCGIHYLLGTDGNIYRFDATWDEPRSLPCIWRSARTAGTPKALCVNNETIYVAFSSTESDCSENERSRAGVYLLSKHRRPTHEIIDRQPDISFESPTQIVTGYGEYDAFILDEDERSITGLISDGTKRTVVSALRSPEDIAIDEQGSLYVLDVKCPGESEHEKQVTATVEDQTTLVLKCSDPPEYSESKTVLTADFQFGGTACIEVIGANHVIVGVDPNADVSGENALFQYQADGDIEPVYSFKQSCTQLQRGHSTSGSTLRGLYAIDGDEQRVYFLRESYKNRSDNEDGGNTTTPYTAYLQNRFDSGIPGMEWHRLRLDLDTSMPGTQIRVKYAATDKAKQSRVNWTEAKHINPRDVLLDRATGRYLHISLELIGSEYTSPQVESIRAYFPRRSYIQHLPAIYDADPDTGDFLHRFLTIFETTFAEFDDELAGFTQYLDPGGVPENSLSWLESWLSVATEQSWSVEARRRLLKRSPVLFKKRGTKAGLRELLEIYFSQYDFPEMKHERKRVFSIVEYADFHCPTPSTYDHEGFNASTNLFSSPQEFLILLNPSVDGNMRRAVQQIVNSEKPAHTAGRTVSLQPQIRLGDHTYLGVNSRLPSQDFIVGESSLGRTSVLSGRRRSGGPIERNSKTET